MGNIRTTKRKVRGSDLPKKQPPTIVINREQNKPQPPQADLSSELDTITSTNEESDLPFRMLSVRELEEMSVDIIIPRHTRIEADGRAEVGITARDRLRIRETSVELDSRHRLARVLFSVDLDISSLSSGYALPEFNLGDLSIAMDEVIFGGRSGITSTSRVESQTDNNTSKTKTRRGDSLVSAFLIGYGVACLQCVCLLGADTQGALGVFIVGALATTIGLSILIGSMNRK